MSIDAVLQKAYINLSHFGYFPVNNPDRFLQKYLNATKDNKKYSILVKHAVFPNEPQYPIESEILEIEAFCALNSTIPKIFYLYLDTSNKIMDKSKIEDLYKR